jgi:hypothetical protein
MSTLQLAQVKEGRMIRLLATDNDLMRHPAEVVMPIGVEAVLPGSDGLVRMAIRVTGDKFRLASLEIRDSAWRSSEEDEELRETAFSLADSIRRRDWPAIETILASISRGLAVESIELSDLDTARRVRISRTGAIETQVPSPDYGRQLVERLLAVVNEGA